MTQKVVTNMNNDIFNWSTFYIVAGIGVFLYIGGIYSVIFLLGATVYSVVDVDTVKDKVSEKFAETFSNKVVPHTLYISCDKEHYNTYYNSGSANHGTDCGFDLYCPDDICVSANSIPMTHPENKIDLGVKCKLVNSRGQTIGYDLRPRSSMGSKTPLRLSNSIGTVDPDYRGPLIACVDNNTNNNYNVPKGNRLIQIVAFDGNPIQCVYTTSLDSTDRGEGGFGSTGN